MPTFSRGSPYRAGDSTPGRHKYEVEYVLVSAVLVEGSRHRYVRLNVVRRTSDRNLAVDLRTLQRGRPSEPDQIA